MNRPEALKHVAGGMPVWPRTFAQATTTSRLAEGGWSWCETHRKKLILHKDGWTPIREADWVEALFIDDEAVQQREHAKAATRETPVLAELRLINERLARIEAALKEKQS